MPKWVIYCSECNRPATYAEVDSASIDLADPSFKKPILPGEGDTWDCPFCNHASENAILPTAIRDEQGRLFMDLTKFRGVHGHRLPSRVCRGYT